MLVNKNNITSISISDTKVRSDFTYKSFGWLLRVVFKFKAGLYWTGTLVKVKNFDNNRFMMRGNIVYEKPNLVINTINSKAEIIKYFNTEAERNSYIKKNFSESYWIKYE